MAKSYIREHLRHSDINEEQMEFLVELCKEQDDLIRARFQSRHSNQKRHVATIQFDEEKEQPIQGWYCTCTSGAREVGMCSHVTALLWHLGVQRALVQTAVHPLAADKLLKAVDDSMKFSDDETDSDDENQSILNAVTKTNYGSNDDEDSDW
ncbi:unnamed protein product [Rotaria sp. Silwood2]|nr:unnamed protein product [Rotaria sp. Silwood2]CAF3483485.1 unnamed protein product [Rotaria sp. Silwood2]